MASRSSGIWRWTALLFCVAGLWAGCQGDDVFSLAKASVGLDRGADSKAATADTCTNVADEQGVVHAMVTAVNDERAKHQLPPLRLDPVLTDLADFYACRLVEGGFFAHEDPFDDSTVDVRAANFGYAFLKIGENLAAGQRSVDQAMADFMASSEHRAAILDPAYTDIGIAVKLGGECGIYWVQEFGRPLTAEPTTSKAPADREQGAGAEASPTSKPSSSGPAATTQPEAGRE